MIAFPLRGGVFSAALLLTGQAVAADINPFEAALMSADPRLAFAVLDRDRPAGGGSAYLTLGRGFGLDPETPTGARLGSDVSVEPILYWDDNVNGGSPSDHFTVGDITFTVPDDQRAIPGLVYGAEVTAAGRWKLGHGLTGQLGGSMSVTMADAWDEPQLAAAARSCLTLTPDPHTSWSACAQAARKEGGATEGVETRYRASIEAGRILSGPGGSAWLTTGELAREWFDDGSRTAVTTSITGAVPHVGAVSLSFDYATRIEGRHTRVAGMDASVTTPILGEQITLGAFVYSSEGGRFLGDKRRDVTKGVSITRQVFGSADVTVSLSRTNANFAAYDDRSIGVQLQFNGAPF